jgi:predicted dehydrogenase
MLERGLPVALEKPLATSKADCEAICRAEREFGGRTLVGFVLRSTPFYRRARELLAGGAVGRITSCQADELPGTGVSSVMNRSVWRRYTRFSGGAMLEKSCHDMDIMNWLIDSRPVELVSFGDSLIFRGNATLPDTCESCPAGEKCLYYMQPTRSSQEDEGEEVLGKFIREDNCCIYNSDKDTVDTQSVMIRYENGAMANFMLNFNCMGPRSGRNLHLIGTRGRIWGNHAEEKVFHHDNACDTTHDYETAGDGTGHGGGDRLHALTLLEMMKNPEFRPAANATMGYLSAMMCLATDVSRRENRFVRFRYRTDGLVDFE